MSGARTERGGIAHKIVDDGEVDLLGRHECGLGIGRRKRDEDVFTKG